MLAKINTVLTPPRRKALYGVVVAIMTALIAFNIIEPGDISDSLTAIVGVLGGLTSLLAFFNVSPGPHDQQ